MSEAGGGLPAVGLTSDLLARAGFAHAFFDRRGGVSPPPYDTLSFSIAVGDVSANVEENLRRAAARLGVAPGSILYASQVHGADVLAVTGAETRDEVLARSADAVLAAEPGVACGVRSADCVPILVGDPATGSVVAVHSGWKGTVLDVVGAGVRALLATGAGRPEAFVAAIGPHVRVCCFEVGPDVADAIAAAAPLDRAAVVREGDGKPRVDLCAVVRAQLSRAGMSAARVDDVPGCTVCEPERFHSYRRSGPRSGRMLSAIVSRGPAASR